MRQAVHAQARGKIESEAELEDLVRQADKNHLLKDDEHQALIRTLGEAKDDHQAARAFLLRRVEAEKTHELQKLDLGHRYGLEQERLVLELATARRQMEAEWEVEARRLDFKLGKERRLAEFRREQESAEQDSRRRAQVEGARTAAAIGDAERDQDEKDVLMGIGLYRQFKGVKREDAEERQRAELEAEETRLAMELQAEEQRLGMRLKESREQHDYELKRIDTLSGAGIETLIAVSGPEQAQILAGLARTRALSGCSPEQILAMQAEESPQVADALKEILTATAASGQLDQYERLVEELKDSATMSREDHQRNISTMQEMFNKALDTVRDTAVAFSGQPSPAS
jgi:hypothetical protein